MKNFLSLVIIVKDEDAFLDEFIAYYKMLGVDHFYFYDNDSAIPLKTSLERHKKYVTINTISGRAKQMDAYQHYINTYKKDSRWAGFIDLDEFILPKKANTLKEFMADYEYADALGINWTLFGHNGHITKPEGLVTENYTRREYKQNIHIKSIINPQQALNPLNPHYFQMKPGATYIDVKHSPITSAFNDHYTLDVAQINHYFTKSEEEFIKKAERGRADTGEKRNVAIEFEQYKEIWNEHSDTFLVEKYLADLKKELNTIK